MAHSPQTAQNTEHPVDHEGRSHPGHPDFRAQGGSARPPSGMRRMPIQKRPQERVSESDLDTPPPSKNDIPKDHTRMWILGGLGLLTLAVALTVWGFVAPAVNEDVPPVMEDPEVRTLP